MNAYYKLNCQSPKGINNKHYQIYLSYSGLMEINIDDDIFILKNITSTKFLNLLIIKLFFHWQCPFVLLMNKRTRDPLG